MDYGTTTQLYSRGKRNAAADLRKKKIEKGMFHYWPADITHYGRRRSLLRILHL